MDEIKQGSHEKTMPAQCHGAMRECATAKAITLSRTCYVSDRRRFTLASPTSISRPARIVIPREDAIGTSAPQGETPAQSGSAQSISASASLLMPSLQN